MPDTMTLIEKTVFLKSVEVLHDVPTEALAQLAARATEVRCNRGAPLFREGDEDQGTYLVVEGVLAPQLVQQRFASGQADLNDVVEVLVTAVVRIGNGGARGRSGVEAAQQVDLGAGGRVRCELAQILEVRAIHR